MPISVTATASRSTSPPTRPRARPSTTATAPSAMIRTARSIGLKKARPGHQDSVPLHRQRMRRAYRRPPTVIDHHHRRERRAGGKADVTGGRHRKHGPSTIGDRPSYIDPGQRRYQAASPIDTTTDAHEGQLVINNGDGTFSYDPQRRLQPGAEGRPNRDRDQVLLHGRRTAPVRPRQLPSVTDHRHGRRERMRQWRRTSPPDAQWSTVRPPTVDGARTRCRQRRHP